MIMPVDDTDDDASMMIITNGNANEYDDCVEQ
jgi:hypothetical protein